MVSDFPARGLLINPIERKMEGKHVSQTDVVSRIRPELCLVCPTMVSDNEHGRSLLAARHFERSCHRRSAMRRFSSPAA